jgi:uncharacterized protein
VRDMMAANTLASLIAGVDAFGDYLRGRGIAPTFSFVWHGGEPLLLPPDYYRRIAQLQQASIQRYPYRNSIQTNLFGVDKESLAYARASDWELGVSIDFAEGIRRNAGGRDSNAKVIAAAEALRASGARFGLISVLGAHNRYALIEAYDWVSQFAEGWRILPLFEGGPEESTREMRLPPEQVAQVFVELFRKRANSKRHLPIAPLDDYAKAAVLRIVDQPDAADIERELLDNIFVINVNGEVFTRPFAYHAGRSLGNVGRQSMQEIMEGSVYRSCQKSIVNRKRHNCLPCDFRGYCDSSAMHEHGSIVQDGTAQRCGVPRAAMAAIHAELTEAGVSAAVVGAWAREWLAHPGAAVA